MLLPSVQMNAIVKYCKSVLSCAEHATQPPSLAGRDLKPGYIKAKQLNVYEGQVLPWQDGLLESCIHGLFLIYRLFTNLFSHLHPTFLIWGG